MDNRMEQVHEGARLAMAGLAVPIAETKIAPKPRAFSRNFVAGCAIIAAILLALVMFLTQL